MKTKNSFSHWVKGGTPWIWLNAGAVSISLFLVFGVLALTASRGLVHFWPSDVAEIRYAETGKPEIRLTGELKDEEAVDLTRLISAGINLPASEDPDEKINRHLLKTGNRDALGMDFRWIIEPFFIDVSYPKDLLAVERLEWGNQYGYLKAIKENGVVVADSERAWPVFQERLARVQDIFERIHEIEKSDIGRINYQLEKLRLAERRLELDGNTDPAAHAAIKKDRQVLKEEYTILENELATLFKQINRDSYSMEIMDGRVIDYPMAKVVHAIKPNAMTTFEKISEYIYNFWNFVSDAPREANTEGGIFPAIFGTVLMVMLMSIIVTPLGVVAAIYLREYAKQGFLTRVIRIAVNNLAGVPSIVYGLFGLGFFVYFLGGSIDALFYPENLPAPTFGTGGILWASLTLAILTLPVVIVATEEGLSRVPRAIREGSLALGATKSETLWRTVIPMASPAIMTGLILAVARAAGEVAPLMLVGVVKLAPTLPLDWNVPFLHLDRKFMHLGFHVYDVGFQSPNIEAARPLVYATAFLLVLVIITLNLSAIAIRNHLREKYRNLEN